MASIISADVTIDGVNKQVLFFSNPNNKETRTHMTIKASLDGGLTWPAEYQVELNAAGGYGYSCMTMADEKSIGILYEGNKELFFQKVPVKEIIKDHFE
jgi:sialidase-1